MPKQNKPRRLQSKRQPGIQVQILGERGEVKRTVRRTPENCQKMIDAKVPRIKILGTMKTREQETAVKPAHVEDPLYFNITDIPQDGALNLITGSNDLEFLEKCRNDDRKSVRQAAEKRIKDIKTKA